jgi:hypothetical protein
MTTIYHADKIDQRHTHLGTYVDVAGCFELPVGPFSNREQASLWVRDNAKRLTELYGAAAATVANN